ncbi:MAG: glycosyltransferase [Candidatus Thermoplasmatota archaeon]|nr:glycosyltransferase [Candidatus Thermoplasmatota archaeon]
MKIAILHSAMTEGNNGAERLVYDLANEWGSRIYICDYDEKVQSSYPGIEHIVELKRIRHPGSFSRKYLEMMNVMTRRRDVDADFIFYSTPMPLFRIRKDPTPYMYMCYTPERGFYDLRGMLRERMRGWGFPRYQMGYMMLMYRKRKDWDLFTRRVNPDQVITNSRNVMDRYERIYGSRPRTAIPAPIMISRFRNRPSEDFYFTAGGLRPNKRVDMQIEALAGTGEKLVVAGDGPERGRLEKLASTLKADVDFLGRVSEEELIDLYSRCKALIFSAQDEDFGMVPLEAMASGKPVLCVNEGGPLEYLNGKVSFLFEDAGGLRGIVQKNSIDDYTSMRDDCLSLARRFDRPVIAGRMRKEIELILEEFY